MGKQSSKGVELCVLHSGQQLEIGWGDVSVDKVLATRMKTEVEILQTSVKSGQAWWLSISPSSGW